MKKITGLCLFLFLLSCVTLLAQIQGKGEIAAQIKDDRGAALPGVTVSLKGVGCQCKSCKDPEKCECCPDEIVVVSNAQGQANFYVAPGTYSLTASMQGFESAATQVQVATSSTYSVMITLEAEHPEIQR